MVEAEERETPSVYATLVTLPMRLFRHTSRRRRYQFLLLLGLTLVSAVAEVVSLGSVLPFISVLTQPERALATPFGAWFARTLSLSTASDLVLPLAIAFALAAILAAALRLALLWFSIRLTNATGADLSVEVYRRTLYQPYSVHVSRSSSEIIAGITQKVTTATSVLASLASVITSAALFIAILLTLFAIDPVVASIAMAGFGASYLVMGLATRHRLSRNSTVTAREQTQVVKALQEGLGAIRDVLLDGTQKVYGGVYRRAIQQLQLAISDSMFLNQAPRYGMEALGMVLIAGLAIVVSRQSGGVGAGLPVLGALALGAQRILPLMQQLYGNWAIAISGQASLVDVLELLDQPLPADVDKPAPPPLEFSDSIVLSGVRFRYRPDLPWVIDGVDLTIPKGSRVGFIGTTGSGKSTVLDLLMSLLDPTEGKILVDGRQIGSEQRQAWQRAIAHVPQSIFLADATIAENIAFGVARAEIDEERVRAAARWAQVSDFIESRPEGYNAVVGERGVRLSGGQRQRIGIARALYKEAQILVFDEATSALDGTTEMAVMDSIENLHSDFTILIVAHRLTTLRNCDTIVKFEHGRIVDQGTFSHFLGEASPLPTSIGVRP